ncbi:MAG: hypothetical protein NWE96_02390 [Candidatus Bathyarchaeota archaeon]|nr:hypothetical protein [Candidatus Bathyarchaeota archaeon]
MGKTPATYCEAKIEPLNANNKSLFDPSILHWVRRFLEPKIGPENTFSPITINAKDHEFLAMLILINDNGTNIPRISLKSASHRPYNFAANTRYKIKVTVFSSNHGPVSKNFSLLWNGEWDGFNTDVIKVVSD